MVVDGWLRQIGSSAAQTPIAYRDSELRITTSLGVAEANVYFTLNRPRPAQ